jgi:hypothetical protein
MDQGATPPVIIGFPDSNNQAGREVETNKVAAMTHHHHLDMIPSFAFLQTMLQDTKADILKGFKEVDLDKLIEPKKYRETWDHPKQFQCNKGVQSDPKRVQQHGTL